jgi:hypothetical protein
MADLPPDQVLQRTQRLLDRRHRVRAVQHVDVDVVGAEPPQAGLDRGHDVAARGVLRRDPRRHRHAELRAQHDLLAALAEDPAEVVLGAAELAVDVRGVEEGRAELDSLVDDRARRLEVEPFGEIVAAMMSETWRPGPERALRHWRGAGASVRRS